MALLPVQTPDKFTRAISEYTPTAATAADEYPNTGREILRITATGAAVITIAAIADPFGRVENTVITFTGAGQASFGPATPVSLWNAADNNVDVTVDTPANITYGVERLPAPL